ncbi:hypothetical protein PGN_1563 [Porphyromonas gingivalis ATCC 33277]|uniref:Uncharacterized protein n=1 Tax=Porphyromonas gingivalis (strain ATCC 33277 / DSM 20709 / CIP 103683 / JCM 12257 / NCTC 11834 / 2561) TaxID=431947 RepID=B2RL37_PORG3|nr:hypothetical protein PGN_1563 [Porphyromonas gingivalis ATCC 33277]
MYSLKLVSSSITTHVSKADYGKDLEEKERNKG